MRCALCLVLLGIPLCASAAPDRLPADTHGGYLLPNGWRISPIGDAIPTSDLISNMVPTPDGKHMVALTSGYNEHTLLLIDGQDRHIRQTIVLPATWFGLAWSPDGQKLYVSGGNLKDEKKEKAPIYIFAYSNETLSERAVGTFEESIDHKNIFWSGLACHAEKNLLFAANRTAGNIVVFDLKSGELIKRIPTELNPYDVVLSADGSRLFCSNWASDSISVIDTAALEVTGTIPVGDNPSDLELAADGRLFVACANDNAVIVVDTAKLRPVETIITSLHDRAPEGSTPNALALDPEGEFLYVANADNNDIAVVEVEEADESNVLGFLPAGWYPSAVRVSADGKKLYIGNAKGMNTSSTVHGPLSPLGKTPEGKEETTKTTMRGAITVVDIEENRARIRELTEQVYANCPYNDEQLARASVTPKAPSVVPEAVGAGSRIKHVIYIIKENRTYDQVLGDLPQGNGDPRLCIFGREITPNIHKIVEEFVLLDNLYCDAEVSADGHSWSNAAYATDFTEKIWPQSYGGHGTAPYTDASMPGAGYIWDLCQRKGLTYRSYGEYAHQPDYDGPMEPHTPGLTGHVAPGYKNWGARDTENAKEFIREFDAYDANFDSPDPAKRLPAFVVMGLPEDHTSGTKPGSPSPRAAVASNDLALGQIIDRVSHSKYWPEMAIFVIEDDAQNGSDHVDARRTEGMVISPFVRRATVDSTLYTTSSMLRTIELLLGLPPMSQFDAAATPMFAALGSEMDPTPYSHVPNIYDINEMNAATAYGAGASSAMDWTEFDRQPMLALNEIIWKSIKGADSEMPVPRTRFVWHVSANETPETPDQKDANLK